MPTLSYFHSNDPKLKEHIIEITEEQWDSIQNIDYVDFDRQALIDFMDAYGMEVYLNAMQLIADSLK